MKNLFSKVVGTCGMLLLLVLSVNSATAQQYQKTVIKVFKKQSLCLDVQWGILQAGTPIHLWQCNGGDGQWWVYDSVNKAIVNPPSGLCLDVQWANPSSGTPVQLWYCNGGIAQKWTYEPNTHVLKSALGTVLDIQGGVLEAGTLVQTWSRNNPSLLFSQQWTKPAVPNTTCPLQ